MENSQNAVVKHLYNCLFSKVISLFSFNKNIFTLILLSLLSLPLSSHKSPTFLPSLIALFSPIAAKSLNLSSSLVLLPPPSLRLPLLPPSLLSLLLLPPCLRRRCFCCCHRRPSHLIWFPSLSLSLSLSHEQTQICSLLVNQT